MEVLQSPNSENHTWKNEPSKCAGTAGEYFQKMNASVATSMHRSSISQQIEQLTSLTSPSSRGGHGCSRSSSISWILCHISSVFFPSKQFREQIHSQIKCEDQVSTLADVVSSITNNLRLGGRNTPNWPPIIRVTEDESYRKWVNDSITQLSSGKYLTRAHGCGLSSCHHFRCIVHQLASLTELDACLNLHSPIQFQKHHKLVPKCNLPILCHHNLSIWTLVHSLGH